MRRQGARRSESWDGSDGLGAAQRRFKKAERGRNQPGTAAEQDGCGEGEAGQSRDDAEQIESQGDFEERLAGAAERKKRRQPSRRESPHERNKKSPAQQNQIALIESMRKAGRIGVEREAQALDKVKSHRGSQAGSAISTVVIQSSMRGFAAACFVDSGSLCCDDAARNSPIAINSIAADTGSRVRQCHA